ncbi:MAG TPA: Ldh family oxidoreductase [Candidatus Saccharimonadales bacterium]|nr:Ldh family oxidoreductase [Candidatus Saccharimonadales bacterium]
MQISITELREKVLNTFKQKGFNETDAGHMADVLLWADMSGVKPMGIAKMIGSEPVQDEKATAPVEVVRDTKLSQLINAHGAPAPLVCQQATDVAIQKAKEHGFGTVGVNNTHCSSAALAYYVDRIAQENLIGIMMSRAGGSVAPFGSADPLFGTDPMAFGFPTTGEPILFDMATSPVTWTGLLLAKARGEQLPENIAIDGEGNPTTNPTKALEGAMFPFDHGYKGAGLGMVVEILAGPLVASAYCDFKNAETYGNVILAIDPELFVDVAEFKANCSDMITIIKNSRKQKGVSEIRLPGERARAAYTEVQKTGMVDVDELVLKELGYIA